MISAVRKDMKAPGVELPLSTWSPPNQMIRAMPMPPIISTMGWARQRYLASAMRVSMMSCILAAKRVFSKPSAQKALTMRMPAMVSCRRLVASPMWVW